jgi:CrcB protein
LSAPVWLGVAALGALGAVARFLLDATVSRRMSGALPVGTLAVNASGSLALGLLTGLAIRGDTLLLAGSAAIGSYTTFSTWMLETHRLGEDGRFRLGVANVAISVVSGLAAALLGRAIGESL